MKQRPFSPEEVNTLIILLFCAGIASLAWLGRTLSTTKKGEAFVLPQLLGGMLGAAIASFCFGAAAIEWWGVSPLIAIAISGPVGWGGGDLMAGVAQAIAKRVSHTVGGGDDAKHP